MEMHRNAKIIGDKVATILKGPYGIWLNDGFLIRWSLVRIQPGALF
jgi:hypothetical protein